MIEPLVVVVLVALAALAVAGAAGTATGRVPGRTERLAVGVVAGLVALQAVIAGVRVLGAAAVSEQSTFLIYLVVSVCVLPITTQFALAEPTRWGGLVIAVGAVATAVAVWRLDGLWAAGVAGG
ncbi:MAG TPA: hypothetical protein VM367_05480 [Pseudonocardia sp.]|nr:hypothetical protein [Pseudonocardia sp.]